MTLTGTKNKCPYCEKEFFPTPPLVPNTMDREFYGGRIKFFKDVDCDCTAKYKLCIEKRFNRAEVKDELNIVDMIVLKEGFTKEEKIATLANEKIHDKFEEGKIPTLRQREILKKEATLESIPDLDKKLEALCTHTKAELQLMCRINKVKYGNRMSKTELAKQLLINNPDLVVTAT